jgi:hypothetical protein
VVPLVWATVVVPRYGGIDSTQEFAKTYAPTSLSTVLEKMAVLPEGVVEWFIGKGVIVPWSDIGYVIVVHLGGLILLALMLGFYLYLWGVARRGLRYEAKKKNWQDMDSRWRHIWWLIITLMMGLLLVGNLKNLYFFTRGYHELFVAIVALAVGLSRSPIPFGRDGGSGEREASESLA